jgi:hypothetical protein
VVGAGNEWGRNRVDYGIDYGDYSNRNQCGITGEITGARDQEGRL